MDLAKHRIKDDGYLVLLIAVFSLPVYFFDVSNSTILGIYLVLLAFISISIFPRFKAWWFPGIIGLIILLPGPLDRMYYSVQLSPEPDTPAYGVISVIDILMFATLVVKLWEKRRLKNLFNAEINYLTLALIAITFLGMISSLQSYFNYPLFHFPMAVRAIFYSVRFLLVFSWISNYFNDISTFKKFPVAIYLITLAFFFLVLLSPKENYEGGNRLSVATYGVNTFGHLLAFTSLLCIPFISYYYKLKKSGVLLGLTACFLICLLFLLLSANRMSFVLLLLGILFYNLFMPVAFAKKIRLIFLFIIVLATVIFLFFLFKPDLLSRVFGVFELISGKNAIENIGELQARFVVWNISWEMITTHPLLGAGPGQWNYLKHEFGSMPPWMTTILDPHNGYLLYASEMGLICTFIYYSIIIACIRKGYRAFKQLKKVYLADQSRDTWFYMSAILMLSIIIVCWLLADLTNASGLNIRVQSLMWSLACILFISPSLVKKYIKANHES